MQDMKEITNRWLARNFKGKGVMACGVLYADQTSTNYSASSVLPTTSLDNVWNNLAGAFQFLKAHQAESDQMRWVFENFFLHCATRGDNACLGIFTSKNEEEYDPALVNRMISEFRAMAR